MNKRAVEKESPIEKNVPLNGWPQSLKAVCENDVPALQQKKGLNGTTNERTVRIIRFKTFFPSEVIEQN